MADATRLIRWQERRFGGFLRAVAANILVAVLLAVLARLSALTGSESGQGPVLWLPVGLAMAAVLRWGPGLLPGVFAGSLAPDLPIFQALGHLGPDPGPWGRAGLGLVGAFDAWIGAYLIFRVLGSGDPFRTPSGTVKALILAVVGGAVPGLLLLPTLPAGAALQAGDPYGAVSLLVARASGFLAIAPLVTFDPKSRPDDTRAGIPWWEATLIWAGVAVTGAMILLDWPEGLRSFFDPLLVGLVAWGALRLTYPYPVLVACASGAILIFGTSLGIGPFVYADWPSPLLLASLHQVVMSLLALILAGMAATQRSAGVAQVRSDELLRQLQALAANSPDSGILIYDRDMRILVARVAESVPLPFNPASAEGKHLEDLDLPGWKDREAFYRAPLEGRAAQSEFNLYGRTFRSYFLPVFLGDRGATSGIAIWQDITEKRRLERELEESRIRLQELARHLMAVREEERTRIARTVHDSIGQTLTGIKLDVAWLARRCYQAAKGDGQGEEISARLADLAAQADQAVAQARHLAAELRPGVLDHLGLAAAITWQADEYRKRSEIDFEVAVADGPTGLSRDAETSIFRVLQELLHNAVRHASANHIWITLDHDAESVTLEVEDDGGGCATEPGSTGFGLVDIRERARQLGGSFEIKGEPGQGTRAVLRVPVCGAQGCGREIARFTEEART